METNSSQTQQPSIVAPRIVFTNHVPEAIDSMVEQLGNPPVYVLMDVNTQAFVMPLLQAQSSAVAKATAIITKAGDMNKNLEALSAIWKQLSDSNASRNSVLINVGGGLVSDLGGLAAATYKRGIKVINIPTTLLAAVDASVGGKTAINFNGIKNQIGVFNEPEAVIVSTMFFNTLPQQQLLSGYAELIKHGLLDSTETLDELLSFSVVYPRFNSEALMKVLEDSVMIKARYVRQDFTDRNLRHALNLGHTMAHAIEAYGMEVLSPEPHGYAVAWGLVLELILSQMELGLDDGIVKKLADYVLTNYGAFDIIPQIYDKLIDFMRNDKKNTSPDDINFTLLRRVGEPVIDCSVSSDRIKTAFDTYRTLMKLA
ncbi:MAG: 3-dehydroquinate synthase [Muribaculaceae bacterium]|nr:3-dehydroquinate synthase [Muribaculaceae bacterium]